MSELLASFHLENKGNNYVTCKARINHLGLNIDHYLNRIDAIVLRKTVSEDEVIDRLNSGVPTERGSVKKYIRRYNLVPYVCRDCGITNNWNNKPISLQLEHINGISSDNRIDNLCFLCPNCHSQTDTYAGKRHKKIYRCLDCNKPICNKQSKRCVDCANIKLCKDKGKILGMNGLPQKEVLIEQIKNNPLEEVAKMYGLSSGNSIKKWCVKLGIDPKEISPFSRKNRNVEKKLKDANKQIVEPTSLYMYVVYRKERDKWVFCKKEDGKRISHGIYDTELEAAEAVKNYFGASELIINPKRVNMMKQFLDKQFDKHQICDSI